ncbi:SAM-dependent methyltransferase [Actinomadura hibisca]|uniref:SAM-dependent methyltransferase n=1 Tax=Actinomadura hibisca TaxID=68565 RepID=UPI0008375D6D|nr:SAM-dependent methyltransferase [Actinomadura hibisca]
MTDATPDPAQTPLPKINTEVPQSARIWNYWLGGTDNYEVDRVAGEQYKAVFPDIEVMARHSRVFLSRAVTHLAGELGLRQFLDIGTGLPTHDNTHEVAQRAAPDAKIVYVDNDPLVLAHARALLTSTPEGRTTYIDADVREPEKIVELAGETLDLTQPIVVMFMGILGHIQDDDEVLSIVRRTLSLVPSGSYLCTYECTDVDQTFLEAQEGYDDTGAVPYKLRSPKFVERYFDGLEVVEPGVVPLPRWRPEGELTDREKNEATLCGVARKP